MDLMIAGQNENRHKTAFKSLTLFRKRGEISAALIAAPPLANEKLNNVEPSAACGLSHGGA